MKILGREPAVFWGLVATVAQALLLLLDLDPGVQGAANAVLLGIAGFLTAASVSVDAALPALTGLLKAAFALILALGVDLPSTTQVAILAVVTAVGAFFVRQQVVAKVQPSLRPV